MQINSRRSGGVSIAAVVAMAGLIGSTGANGALAAETSRFGGSDRVDTSIKIFEGHREAFTSDTVVLAGSLGFADALTASPLAAALKAPVLTTAPADLDARVLKSLKAQGVKNVVVVGGSSAVSPAAAEALKSAGLSMERIGGTDRFATARLVAKKVMSIKGVTSVPVFVANGMGYADALAAGSAAAKQGAVILLSSGNTFDRETEAFIKDEASSVVAVGGGAAAAVKGAGIDAVTIVGADRFATAAAVASKYFDAPTNAVLASGLDYADAVSGSALAALTGAPMLLTAPAGLPAATASYLAAKKPNIAILGGPRAVSSDVEKKAEAVADTGDVKATTPVPTPAPTPTPTPSNTTPSSGNGSVYVPPAVPSITAGGTATVGVPYKATASNLPSGAILAVLPSGWGSTSDAIDAGALRAIGDRDSVSYTPQAQGTFEVAAVKAKPGTSGLLHG